MSMVLSPSPERVGGPAVDAMVPVPYRVAATRRETEDTVTLLLAPVAEAIADPAPGQFNMLYAVGVGEVPISVSGGDARGLHHTVRAVGPVSQALCALEPGAVLGVRGPFGTEWGLEAAAGGDVIVLAGGIGLAPLRPVVQALIRSRAAYRRVAVLIGARRPDEIVFAGESRAWRDDAVIDVLVTVDQAGRSWPGDVGVVTTLLGRVNVDPEVTTAFVCGPEVMIRFTAAEVMARGVNPERIRVSLERSMQCGIGRCGHCQLGPLLVCVDGPVLPWSRVAPLLVRREL
jgi:anaerobic sulfite reductase subunit B